jgi:hypothetical protein
MVTFIHFDILDLGKLPNVGSDQGDAGDQAIAPKLIQSDRQVLEFTVSLINSMSSETIGAKYLMQKEYVIDKLVQILYMEKNDSVLRQNALGALQKFSLKRKAQNQLIRQDIIKWIVELLNDDFLEISEYS